MKANYIPAMVMLVAGFVDCIFGFLQNKSPLDCTIELLIVLIIFYFIGTVIKWFYVANFKEAEEENTENTESTEESKDLEGAEETKSEDAKASKSEEENTKETDSKEN